MDTMTNLLIEAEATISYLVKHGTTMETMALLQFVQAQGLVEEMRKVISGEYESEAGK